MPTARGVLHSCSKVGVTLRFMLAVEALDFGFASGIELGALSAFGGRLGTAVSAAGGLDLVRCERLGGGALGCASCAAGAMMFR